MTYREELAKLSEAFDQAAPYLKAAIDHDRSRGYDISDIKENVMLGKMQLWGGDDWAAVTEILCYPRRKTIMVHLAGGNLQGLLDAEKELVEFAKLAGADYIELIGRRGWVRQLKSAGYEEAATHIVKEIHHVR